MPITETQINGHRATVTLFNLSGKITTVTSETRASKGSEIPTVHNQFGNPIVYIIILLIMALLSFLIIICWKFWLWMNKRGEQNLSAATDLHQTSENNANPIYETINFVDDNPPAPFTNGKNESSHNETNENTTIDQRDTCVTHQILMRNASSPLHVIANEAYAVAHDIELTNNESYHTCIAQSGYSTTSKSLS